VITLLLIEHVTKSVVPAIYATQSIPLIMISAGTVMVNLPFSEVLFTVFTGVNLIVMAHYSLIFSHTPDPEVAVVVTEAFLRGAGWIERSLFASPRALSRLSSPTETTNLPPITFVFSLFLMLADNL
jgi:hypothetical protein